MTAEQLLCDRIALAIDVRLDGSLWNVNDLAGAVMQAIGLDDFEAAVERMADAYLSTNDPFDAQEDFRVALRAALNLGGGQ
jgi:hypothetical protein